VTAQLVILLPLPFGERVRVRGIRDFSIFLRFMIVLVLGFSPSPLSLPAGRQALPNGERRFSLIVL